MTRSAHVNNTIELGPHSLETYPTATKPTKHSVGSLAKRIHDLVESEEKEFRIFHSVQDIHDHVLANPVRTPDIGIDLCVYNIEQFEKGWHIAMLDKEAKQAFTEISTDLDKLDFSKQKEFFFRLTIWEDKKQTTLPPDIKPGTSLNVKRVHQLQIWKGLLQGSIRVDEFQVCSDRKKTKKNET